MMMSVNIPDAFNGLINNSRSWTESDWCTTSGMDSRAFNKWVLKLGYRHASWNARVGKMVCMLLLFKASREQKKLAPSLPVANDSSAKLWAMVDFSLPAIPFNQYTRKSRTVEAHSSMACSTFSRVPRRHFWWCWEEYPASRALCSFKSSAQSTKGIV